MANAPYVQGSATSKAAAEGIDPHRKNMAWRIFQHLTYIPSTCHEIEFALGFKHQTASARFSDLTKAGCIRPTGEQRRTDNAEADVYEVIPGAAFTLFDAYQSGKPKKTVKLDVEPLLAAAKAYAEACALGAPEDIDQATKTLLGLSIKTFPVNEERESPVPNEGLFDLFTE